MNCESVHTGLTLFSLPQTQTAMEDAVWVEYEPLVTRASTSAVKFAISTCKLCTLCAWNESRVYGTLGSLGDANKATTR